MRDFLIESLKASFSSQTSKVFLTDELKIGRSNISGANALFIEEVKVFELF